MADQADVEAALAGIVGGALYPNGLEAGCAVSGAVVRIYRGWPTPAALDSDLAAGRINVSVGGVPGSTRLTTRYPDQWRVVTPAVTTLSAVQIGVPTAALVAQLNAALNLHAVLPAPCGSGCDAAKIMRALG